MKKIITLFLFLITIFLCASCEVTDNGGLTQPKVTVENTTITWQEVNGAEKYNIYLEDELYDDTIELTYTFYNLEVGTYKVVVEATKTEGEEVIWKKSKPVTLEIKEVIDNTITLDSPVITLEDNRLSWEKVENAQKYVVYINDEKKPATYNTTYILPTLTNGEYSVYVVALYEDAKNKLEAKSNVITFTVEEVGERIVNIFMINDTHGSFHTTTTPGLEKIGTIIKTLEEENGDYIKVVNGDALQGSYVSSTLHGRPIIDALNVMDFDAFVLGNHEFDWGLDKIQKYKDGDPSNGEANFPFLGANIYDKKTNQRVSWIEPYTIVEKNGVKVGIIGIIGHSQESSILAPMVENYDFVYPLEIVKALSQELRTEKDCDSVIVSLHDFDEELQASILNLPLSSRVDAILCAHYHQNEFYTGLNAAGVNVPVVQNRDKNQTATNLILNLDASTSNNYEFERLYPFNYQDDSEVLEVIEKYRDTITSADEKIGTAHKYLDKATLGAHACDAMSGMFKTDVAIMNTGGIRAAIGTGTITVGEVFESLPFDNEVIIVNLKGSVIQRFYNSSSAYYNTRFNINNIDYNTYYKVAIIDYVFFSSYNSYLRVEGYEDTDVVLRDLLITYITTVYLEN